MFCSSRTSPLAQRALGALRLTRSFILLEDDYDVDWEVDQSEHLRTPHPHRAPLRERGRTRAGAPQPASHTCLSPTRSQRPDLVAPSTRAKRGASTSARSSAFC
jgi:hypothetical protein